MIQIIICDDDADFAERLSAAINTILTREGIICCSTKSSFIAMLL